MKVTPIKRTLPGERVVSVHPPMGLQVDGKWRRRLNLYTGRTLSDTALKAEQNGRAGRLVTMGQAISPGVVTGLELDLEPPSPDRPGPLLLNVAPGIGLAHSGEDVVLPRVLRVPLPALYFDFDTGQPQPRIPVDVRILVLEPAVVRVAGRSDPTDPCDVDESEDAFADEQTVDACRLRTVPWRNDWGTLPQTDSQFRNQLAYQIFERERLLQPGELQPWEHYGVPIGVLTWIDVEGFALIYVDRYAVARQGGRAKGRTSLFGRPLIVQGPDTSSPAVTGIGTSFLWQARIQQFAEQIADPMEQGRRLLDRANDFRFLPPAGVLPVEALRFTGLVEEAERVLVNQFLPMSWRLAAAPLPIEQLDQLINRAAALDALNAQGPEDILIVVPVPQAVYEPRLLMNEQMSPVFAETISTARVERDRWRGLRYSVRRDYRALVRASEGPQAVPKFEEFNPEYPETEQVPPDAGALGDEVSLVNQPVPIHPDADGGRFGVTSEQNATPVAQLTVTARAALRASFDAQKVFSATELADFDAMGLAPFIAKIEAKLTKADDTIDFSFLKSHPNIYRVRQLMLGNTASTRLATSPVLATIAKGASASAVSSEINRFFYAVKGRKPPGVAPPPKNPVPPPPAAPARAIGIQRFMYVASPKTIAAFAGFAPKLELGASTAFPALGASGIKAKLKTEVGRTSIVLLPGSSTRQTVQQAPPIVGEGAYDFRTSSIAERIEDSPSREAKSYAVAAKAEAIEAIELLRAEQMNVDDIPIFGVVSLKGEDANGYGDGAPDFHLKFLDKANNETDTVQEGNIPNPRRGLVKRRAASMPLLELILKGGGIGRILKDPPGENADEGNLFSDAVAVIEHSVATLRAVEGRIAAYRGELARCKDVLAVIDGLKNAAARRLSDIGDHIIEERHRASTALALLEDEGRRLALIRERRQQVLDHHVQFYAYVRPRAIEALVDGPTVNLDPGLFESPVPACLAAHTEAPHELEEMVQLLREAPVAWFSKMPQLLEKLDRVELLHGTLQVAKLRAMSFRDFGAAPSTFVVKEPVGKLGKAIFKTTQAQQRAVTDLRIQVAQLDLARFGGKGWRETREEAVQVLSLGDLIESNHGRSYVAEQAAKELTQIGRIAACLYAQASDVVPAIRLEWAERLSQYEESVSLRDLTALPRWGEVPYIDRKEIQVLADWLYGRIDLKHQAGSSWMHDLVRVCLLLASHAPVNEIIAGDVPVATPASPGRTVPVNIDPRKVRLGMTVMFFQSQELVAHGVVEDLVGGQARTRIAETKLKSVTLGPDTRAHFVDPEARTSPTFFRKLF